MGDYFAHWLALGERLQGSGATLPAIFCVNWFRTDEKGKFIWPGFSENMRVLKWMIDRLEGRGEGVEHLFGTSPRYEHMHWDGLSFSREAFDRIMSIDADAWREEFRLHDELFERLADRLPEALVDTKKRFEEKLESGA